VGVGGEREPPAGFLHRGVHARSRRERYGALAPTHRAPRRGGHGDARTGLAPLHRPSRIDGSKLEWVIRRTLSRAPPTPARRTGRCPRMLSSDEGTGRRGRVRSAPANRHPRAIGAQRPAAGWAVIDFGTTPRPYFGWPPSSTSLRFSAVRAFGSLGISFRSGSSSLSRPLVSNPIRRV